MIEVVDVRGELTRHVDIAWSGFDCSVLEVTNCEDCERVLQIDLSPKWLVAEPADDLVLPPFARRQIILRVNWSLLSSGARADGRAILREGGEELWRVDVSATADIGEEYHLVVLGDGVVDFGEFHLGIGPMAPAPPRRFLHHDLTISAERGSFSGRLRVRRKWLRYTLRNGREMVNSRGFTLTPGEAGRISICVDLLGVKPNREYHDVLRVESTPGGKVVASVEIRFAVSATRRPLEFALPGQLDLGRVPGSLTVHRTVTLHNDGHETVEATVRGSPKWLNVRSPSRMQIAPRSAARVEMVTEPSLAGYQSGEVSFLIRSSTGETRVLTLPVFGTFVDPAM